ncbi:hypothetical protein HPP92_004396 [Vanilla planifolia]|uniref:Aspergillus nuclease S1 n=1 Tax=Vanilla planifolia TaxID=51239 RepID=A0A835RM93_VANPL|nr:hypothetical protein HPP92_004814 [Vanilla planifolia]KAG0493402.1 hypothetical protein HPP92_004396 [Vanilla planifolia]
MASTFHIASVFTLIFSLPVLSHGWGTDGHYIVCQIAQQRLSDAAARAVNELLPDYAKTTLAVSALGLTIHQCASGFMYQTGDCKDESGVQGDAFLEQSSITPLSYVHMETVKTTHAFIKLCLFHLLCLLTKMIKADNLTQALLFLSHFMGDIHQPLHVSHTSDKGGNTIDVQWYHKKTVLHHVWDDSIIDTAEDHFYGNEVDKYIDALQRNITGEWSSQIPKWQSCSGDKTTCPDIYASESISAACDWAYKGVTDGAVLEDEYFNTRLPIVDLRLAQAGVRLAATLNRIFS